MFFKRETLKSLISRSVTTSCLRAVRAAGPVKLTLHHHQVRKVDLVIRDAISLTSILRSAGGPFKLALHHYQICQVYLAVHIDISRTRTARTGITAPGISGVGLSRQSESESTWLRFDVTQQLSQAFPKSVGITVCLASLGIVGQLSQASPKVSPSPFAWLHWLSQGSYRYCQLPRLHPYHPCMPIPCRYPTANTSVDDAPQMPYRSLPVSDFLTHHSVLHIGLLLLHSRPQKYLLTIVPTWH